MMKGVMMMNKQQQQQQNQLQQHQQQQQQQQQTVLMMDHENMSNLTSVAAASGEASCVSSSSLFPHPQRYFSSHQPENQQQPPQIINQAPTPPPKKKRNLPGNPDPDAEVISLSPKSLLATNRFLCEICNKGFQRDQNLQLHRRGHNLPWKLKQRSTKDPIRKKVYVCPEPSCVHHDPSRALGDLTGIKKHFCRKHGEKKWKCEKCSKRYAVQSDWKAHSKTCGTREYRCDCGTLFSRRDSFITHRAFCDALAEETVRSITVNHHHQVQHPLHHLPTQASSSSSILAGSSSSHHHLMNLQQQHHQQQQQNQFNVPSIIHPFQLKREQHTLHPLPPQINNNSTFNMMMRSQDTIPPWLSCPLPPPSAATPPPPPIFNQMGQDFHQTTHVQHEGGPNPNSSVGSTVGPLLQVPSSHMSATALLQKAAQMGATMSTNNNSSSSKTTCTHHHQHHHGHVTTVSAASVSASATTMTAPSSENTAVFGLNLSSSREDISTGFINNHHNNGQLTTSDHDVLPAGAGAGAGAGALSSSSSSSLLHDMMNSLSSGAAAAAAGFQGGGYDDDAFGAMMDQKDAVLGVGAGTFFQSTESKFATGDQGGRGRRGGRDEGLTRDFLGLRPLSHNEILNMAAAGLGGGGMNSADDIGNHHGIDEEHHPWRG